MAGGEVTAGGADGSLAGEAGKGEVGATMVFTSGGGCTGCRGGVRGSEGSEGGRGRGGAEMGGGGGGGS